ncbi:MAG TPA: STAS domain-containing protein [Pyrinomonadaceae bacterium]|nr:STAS domain-containing protein [Pyrinomonadaceae bacterium]
MPLRITQKEDSSEQKSGKVKSGNNDQVLDCMTVLKVEGSLYVEDAELLERICRDIGNEAHGLLTLDLADLNFLDSESASVLCRLRREQGVRLEGLHLFIEKVVELTEAEATVSKYLHPADEAAFDLTADERGRTQI